MMRDHEIPDSTERQYPVDPVESAVATIERNEEAYTEEIRTYAIDALQILKDGMANVDYDYPDQSACDTRLLVLGVMATLGEV